jgi:FlaA1/EpsC-like NDP-sugar epimerase
MRAPASHKEHSWQPLIRCTEVALDFVTIWVSLAIGNLIYLGFHLGKHVAYTTQELCWIGSLASVVFIILLAHDGAYHSAGSLMRIRETERVLRSAFITFMLAIAVSFLIQRHMSRLLIVISGMVAVTLLIVQKQTASRFINDLHIKGFGMKRVALYGAGETGKRIFSALQRSPKVGLLPVVCFDTDSALTDDRLYEAGYRRQFSIPILTCEPTAVLLMWRC